MEPVHLTAVLAYLDLKGMSGLRCVSKWMSESLDAWTTTGGPATLLQQRPDLAYLADFDWAPGSRELALGLSFRRFMNSGHVTWAAVGIVTALAAGAAIYAGVEYHANFGTSVGGLGTLTGFLMTRPPVRNRITRMCVFSQPARHRSGDYFGRALATKAERVSDLADEIETQIEATASGTSRRWYAALDVRRSFVEPQPEMLLTFPACQFVEERFFWLRYCRNKQLRTALFSAVVGAGRAHAALRAAETTEARLTATAGVSAAETKLAKLVQLVTDVIACTKPAGVALALLQIARRDDEDGEVGTLIDAFLTHFPQGLPTFLQTGAALQCSTLANRCGVRLLSLINEDAWAKQSEIEALIQGTDHIVLSRLPVVALVKASHPLRQIVSNALTMRLEQFFADFRVARDLYVDRRREVIFQRERVADMQPESPCSEKLEVKLEEVRLALRELDAGRDVPEELADLTEISDLIALRNQQRTRHKSAVNFAACARRLCGFNAVPMAEQRTYEQMARLERAKAQFAACGQRADELLATLLLPENDLE